MIQYVTGVINSQVVMITTAYHVRKIVNELNGKDILTSNFYYDILKGQPYLKGDDFVIRDFEKRFPEEYERVVADMRAAGILKGKPTHFITYTGVFNILHVYGIETKSLLKGGERIPFKQDKLFKTPEDNLNSTLDKLFTTGKDLAVQDEVDTTNTMKIKPNHRVYVREYQTAEEKVVLGLNYGISNEVSRTFPIVRENIDGDTGPLCAQIYVTEIAGRDDIAVVIRFVPRDTVGAVVLRRTLKDELMSNIALRKTASARGVMRLLDSYGISGVATREVDIIVEKQTVIAYY